MLFLNDKNDPFLKESQKTPEFIKKLMEEYNLTFEMFTEAYGDPAKDPMAYMYGMLYEYEVFKNEIYQHFLDEEAAYYLNEAGEAGATGAATANPAAGGAAATANSAAAKAGFFSKMKEATAKISTGIANFFKRAFEVVRNKVTTNKITTITQGLSKADQRKFLKAVKFYTAEEIDERNRIYLERVKVLDGILNSVKTATDTAVINSLTKQVDTIKDEYDKKLQDFEDRHAQRVQTGLTIGDLNKAALKRLTNPADGVLTQYQGASEKAVKLLSEFTAKGIAASGGTTPPAATPPAATPPAGTNTKDKSFGGNAAENAQQTQQAGQNKSLVEVYAQALKAIQGAIAILSPAAGQVLKNETAQDNAILSSGSETGVSAETQPKVNPNAGTTDGQPL